MLFAPPPEPLDAAKEYACEPAGTVRLVRKTTPALYVVDVAPRPNVPTPAIVTVMLVGGQPLLSV